MAVSSIPSYILPVYNHTRTFIFADSQVIVGLESNIKGPDDCLLPRCVYKSEGIDSLIGNCDVGTRSSSGGALSPGLYYVPDSQFPFPSSNPGTHFKPLGDVGEMSSDQQTGEDHCVRARPVNGCKDQTCGGRTANFTYCGIPKNDRKFDPVDRPSVKNFMCRLCWPERNEELIEKHCKEVAKKETTFLFVLLGLFLVILAAAVAGMIHRRYLQRRISRSVGHISSDASTRSGDESRPERTGLQGMTVEDPDPLNAAPIHLRMIGRPVQTTTQSVRSPRKKK